MIYPGHVLCILSSSALLHDAVVVDLGGILQENSAIPDVFQSLGFGLDAVRVRGLP